MLTSLRGRHQVLDDATAWEVVMENVGLVKKVTDRFCRRHDARVFDDLYAEALMGAHRAVKTFDPMKGKLSTHMWVSTQHALTGAWRKYERQSGIIRRIPDEDGKEKFSYERKSFLQDPRYLPDSHKQWRDHDDREADFFTQQADTEDFENDLISRLDAADAAGPYFEEIASWGDRQQDIFFQRIFEERTFEDIGREYDISDSRVHQIVNDGLKKLRKLGDGTAASPAKGEGKGQQNSSEDERLPLPSSPAEAVA